MVKNPIGLAPEPEVKTWAGNSRFYRRDQTPSQPTDEPILDSKSSHMSIDYIGRRYALDGGPELFDADPCLSIGGWAIYAKSNPTEDEAVRLMRENLHIPCSGNPDHRNLVLVHLNHRGSEYPLYRYRWVCNDCKNHTQRAKRRGLAGPVEFEAPLRLGQSKHGVIKGTVAIYEDENPIPTTYSKAAEDAEALRRIAPIMAPETAKVFVRVAEWLEHGGKQ